MELSYSVCRVYELVSASFLWVSNLQIFFWGVPDNPFFFFFFFWGGGGGGK